MSQPHCYLIEFSDNHVISIGAHCSQNSVSLIPQLITLSVRINERDSRHEIFIENKIHVFIHMNVGTNILDEFYY